MVSFARVLLSLFATALTATAAQESVQAIDSPVMLATGAVRKTGGCGRAATIQTGTYRVTVNGKQREYMVRVPQNYDPNRAYRLVFTFHWRGGSMYDAANNAGGWYGLAALAKESTIFVSPQGLNAGWANAGGEDIALVDAIVNKINNGLCVNENLRFATGFSFGGAMSHSVACSRPDVFRAVSVLSGASFSGCAGGTKPIAYQLMHGVNDNVIPISLGRQLRDQFVRVNGCTQQTAQEPKSGSGTHITTSYQGCSAGHPVKYIAFEAATWPSRPTAASRTSRPTRPGASSRSSTERGVMDRRKDVSLSLHWQKKSQSSRKTVL